MNSLSANRHFLFVSYVFFGRLLFFFLLLSCIATLTLGVSRIHCLDTSKRLVYE